MRKQRFFTAFLCAVLVLCLTAVLPAAAMTNDGKIEFNGEKAYYNETDQASVTVNISFSLDGIPILGNDKNRTELSNLNLTVPYFDLAQYDMEELYRYPTDDKADYRTDQPVVKRPTVLHLFLYVLERYAQGLPADQCGQGKLNKDMKGSLSMTTLFGDTVYKEHAMFNSNKNPTMCYISEFWGHDDNMMYYVNHKFPLMYTNWGATMDYILLNDGDTVEVGMFTDRSFYLSGAFVYFPQTTYRIEAGTAASMNLSFTSAMHDAAKYEYTGNGFNWYVMDADRNIVSSGTTDDAVVKIDALDEPGTYRLYAIEKSSKNNWAIFTPASAILEVTESQAVKRTESLLQAIGNVTYTPECKARIDAARTAYDALSPQQKKLVSSALIADLTFAEQQYEFLKAEAEKQLAQKAEQDAQNKAAADAVIAQINAIGEVSYSEETRSRIAAARSAYDVLTAEQKAYISADTLRILTIAETVYATVEQEVQNTQQAAQSVEKLIDAIGAVAYNTQCETAIQAARMAYNTLTDEQKALIPAEKLALLTNAETSYAELKKQSEEQAAAALAQKLEQTKAGKDSVQIQWREDKKATAGYRIYIKGGRYKKFTKVADTKKGVTSYTVKKANKKKLAAGTQYEFKIVSLKKSGKKTVELSAQKLKAVTVTAAPKFSSAKRNKNKTSITLKWKKVSGASGYEIQMSTKAKSGFKKITTTKAKATSYTRKSLSKSKAYYFRMRTYKTVSGKKFYSSWSKTVKVKK